MYKGRNDDTKIAIIILSTLALVSQALETNRIASNELSPASIYKDKALTKAPSIMMK